MRHDKVNIKNLSMSFGTQELFSNVNIYIEEGQKVGVVGLNGAGKTTFFKILMGKEIPDSGKIIFKNKIFIFQTNILKLPLVLVY